MCVCARAVPCSACTGARARPCLGKPSFFVFFPCLLSSVSFSPFPSLFLSPLFSPSFCFCSRPFAPECRVRVCEESNSSHASPQRSMSTRCHASAYPAVTPSTSTRERESDRTYVNGRYAMRTNESRAEYWPWPPSIWRGSRRCPLWRTSQSPIRVESTGTANSRVTTHWTIIMRIVNALRSLSLSVCL